MPRTTLTISTMLWGWCVLVVVWATASYGLKIPQYVLASPIDVVRFAIAHSETVFHALLLTAFQALFGGVIGALLGVTGGALLYYIPWVRRLTWPALLAVQTTPIIATAPLVNYWFGYGISGKIVVVTIVAVLPVMMATVGGLAAAKAEHVFLYKLHGASEYTVFAQVRLKSAWPAILPGLRTACIFAVIGSIVAEFASGNAGIGFLIMKAIYSARSDMLLCSVVASAFIGQAFLVLFELGVSRWPGRLNEL